MCDKKKPSKKKAKVVQVQARDVENALPLLEAQTGGLHADFSLGIFVRPISCACFPSRSQTQSLNFETVTVLATLISFLKFSNTHVRPNSIAFSADFLWRSAGDLLLSTCMLCVLGFWF